MDSGGLKARRRRSSEDDRILPLVNVVFLLLIFFMIAGRLATGDPFRIEPPRSASTEDADLRSIEILISRDGRLAADGVELDLEALRRRLAENVPEQARIRADGGADSALVLRLLALLDDAGIEELSLVTTKAGRT